MGYNNNNDLFINVYKSKEIAVKVWRWREKLYNREIFITIAIKNSIH